MDWNRMKPDINTTVTVQAKGNKGNDGLVRIKDDGARTKVQDHMSKAGKGANSEYGVKA